jgi:molybdate transport system regulatory protein
MKPRYNLWIEKEGEVVLSTWRIKLLEAIDTTGSITSATELMKVPYRRAWERLHNMETRLGFRLLETEVGGSRGGGAVLTDAARDLISRFTCFEEGLEGEIQDRFRKAFRGNKE